MPGLEWLQSLDLNAWLGIGSAAIAVVSFLFNWAVVNRQSAMQFESLKAQTDSDLLAWADSAIDALSEAIWIAKGRGALLSEEETRRRAAQAMQRLSAIADKGRLFFPNMVPQQHGHDKHAAYRGVRPPILDALIFAYFKLERMDTRNIETDAEAAEFLTRCRRLLVSEVQRAVDPRRRGKMLRRLAVGGSGGERPGFRDAAALGVELEDRHPGVLEVKRDEAWVAEMEKRAAKR